MREEEAVTHTAPLDRVFVYGTLRPGGHRWALVAAAGVRAVTPATVPGLLRDFGAWPGMVAGEGTVHGEVVTLRDLAAALPELDAWEGFHGPDHPDNLFERLRCTAATAAGPVEAWAWRYVGPHGGRPVPDGDWLRHCRQAAER